MIAVAIALLVTIIFVDDDRAATRQELIGTQTAEIQDALPGLFIAQEIEDIGTFGRRELRVRMVHIEACPIWQDLVDRHVVLLVRNIVLVVQLEAPGIHQGILLIVVPQ